jgi:hypothetical protein
VQSDVLTVRSQGRHPSVAPALFSKAIAALDSDGVAIPRSPPALLSKPIDQGQCRGGLLITGEVIGAADGSPQMWST